MLPSLLEGGIVSQTVKAEPAGLWSAIWAVVSMDCIPLKKIEMAAALS